MNDNDQEISVAILTISDRCSKGLMDDRSGTVIQKLVEEQGWKVSAYLIVPDEKDDIAATLIDWCDKKKINLILTTGGTGIGPRDITPEVTQQLLDKKLPGISEYIRLEGLKHTRTAALSRAVAGVRGKTVIINLPGSPGGAEESLQAILDIVPHALSMLNGGGH